MKKEAAMRRVFFFLLILPLTPLSASAWSGGIFGRATTGCSGEFLACHHPEPRETSLYLFGKLGPLELK